MTIKAKKNRGRTIIKIFQGRMTIDRIIKRKIIIDLFLLKLSRTVAE
jgi:hypothetical protein